MGLSPSSDRIRLIEPELVSIAWHSRQCSHRRFLRQGGPGEDRQRSAEKTPGKFSGAYWLAEVVALDLLAADPLQKVNLLQSFHALSDDFHAEDAGDVDDGRGEGGVPVVGEHRTDERLIDLQAGELEMAQVTEAAVAHAEIIDCQS